MGNVDQVRAKVQQILTENFSSVVIDSDGDFSLRRGSAQVFVRVWAREGSEPTFVAVTVPLLLEVKPSPELFEFVAIHADDYVFGHLNASRRDDSIDIFLSHTLLGDYLDEAELDSAVGVLLGVADKLDDELKAQFGGRRFHEDT